MMRHFESKAPEPTDSQGFSIIELMVVLVIAGILLGVTAPAFLNNIKNNRLLTESYALRATFANARSEALAQRTRVIICESSDASSCAFDTTSWPSGYLAFIDTDRDSIPDPNEVFLSRVTDTSGVAIAFLDATGTAASQIQFSPRGDSLGFSGTFTLCDDRGDSSARGLILRPSGEIRSAIDSDTPADGIVNNLVGANVSC